MLCNSFNIKEGKIKAKYEMEVLGCKGMNGL